jgi:hypothetical protein
VQSISFGTVFVFVQICRFVLIQIQRRFNEISIINVADRIHDYSGHLKIVISIVGFVIDIRPFYAINSDAVSLFADSSLLVFSEIEYVIIGLMYFL